VSDIYSLKKRQGLYGFRELYSPFGFCAAVDCVACLHGLQGRGGWCRMGWHGGRLLINSIKNLLNKSVFQKKIVYLQNLLSMVLQLEDAAIQRVTTNYDI
jgi:hypothetical protein